MNTLRELIMQAIEARLATVAAVSGRVYRSRDDALSREEAPAIVVEWESESPETNDTWFTEKKLTVVVGVYARAVEPDKAADPITADVHQALMVEPTLGGLAIDISEDGTSLELDEADMTAAFVNMRFVVWYRHARNNLAG